MHSAAYHNDPLYLPFPAAIYAASQRIAPAWPLDTALAVNPWWPLQDHKFSEVAASLETLGRIKCLMPRSFYRALWGTSIQPQQLMQAIKEQEYTGDIDELLAFINREPEAIAHWHNVSDLLDVLPQQARRMPWRDEITQQISQFCGLYFQHADLQASGSNSLYTAWLSVAQKDRGIEIVMGQPGLQAQFLALPDCPATLCNLVMTEFSAPLNFADYAHALLIDIHGWASFLAYTAWQDSFTNTPNTLVEQLVAIRLAWEWVLWCHTKNKSPTIFNNLRSRFLQQFTQLPSLIKQQHAQQQALWVWQNALELSHQQFTHTQLRSANYLPLVASRPVLQAIFCIDVRSEPIRRALEAQHPKIETLGCAGFFGLPIAYTLNDNHYCQPQLPGLLAPSIQATQVAPDKNIRSLSNKLRFLHHQETAFDAAPASLGLVEMLGLFKASSLLKQTFWPKKSTDSLNKLCDQRAFELTRNGQQLTLDEQVSLAASVLKNLGLSKNFAPVILIVGHTSDTTNNPQAAGLNCGACGGQSGEVNAKVLAQLLNNQALRDALQQQEISIPNSTHFVAAVHNTTTDEISYFGEQQSDTWQTWLLAASEQARSQRAESLGINAQDNVALALQARSKSWAELRPEWGLANNADFIVAPRTLTRAIDLAGRAFLHDYDWRNDPDLSILELILTAPMIVTNWINLQYYASVTDNQIYGSGNKLLHNVVGEHIGVFEGNGGDLRIGLAMQSLHDGQQWRHTPVRLNVYILAPRSAIATLVEKHQVVKNLVDNDWLYLFQIDPNSGDIARYYKSAWLAVDGKTL